MRRCRHCDVPLSGRGRSKWCAPCGPIAKAASTARWAHSAHGKASKKAYKNSPRGKIVAALWQDRNRERIRASRREASRRKARIPVGCATESCRGTFIRGPHEGHRMFCHDCSRFYYPSQRRRAA